MLAGVLLAMLLAACSDQPPKQAESVDAGGQAPPQMTRVGQNRSGTVVETMNSGGYTYVHVDTGTEKFWAAAPQFVVAVDDPVVVPEGMPMRNFRSEALGRDFEVIYFVDAVRVGAGHPAPSATPRLPAGHPDIGTQPPPEAGGIEAAGIERAAGGRRIGEIFADKAGFAGKAVAVRGKVVKFNAGVMGKNWIHIQDGTGGPGQNDLTVTTDAVARVGDTVVINGVVATDKDFGFGYSYAVIVEDAEVTVE
jgi:hypothetical protein